MPNTIETKGSFTRAKGAEAQAEPAAAAASPGAGGTDGNGADGDSMAEVRALSRAPIEGAGIPAGVNRPPKKWHQKPLLVGALGLVVAAVLVAVVLYIIHASHYESTDDAFVEADVSPVSTKLAGMIESVNVSENQVVKQGDVIAQIDARDVKARLAAAEANLAGLKAKLEAAQANTTLLRATTAAGLKQAAAGIEQAKANVKTVQSQVDSANADVTAAQAEADRRQADLKRYEALDTQSVSKQQLDAARAAAQAADAQLTAAKKHVMAAEAQVVEAEAKVGQAAGAYEAANTGAQQIALAEAQEKSAKGEADEAQAKVDTAKLDLTYATIVAPVPGRVTRKNLQVGQYVQVGQPLLALVQGNVWVVANFKETQLDHMQPGQRVEVDIDAFPDLKLTGIVQSIQSGTGSRFSLLPPENATGNYVKVVQRVPVKIALRGSAKDLARLAPGMSVSPSVRIDGDGAQAPPKNAKPATEPAGAD